MNKIKITAVSLVALLFVVFTSCSKDEDIAGKSGATVEVLVKYKGEKQTHFPVNMFCKSKGPSTSFFTKFLADKTVMTNDNGIAIFKLQDVYDLEIIDNQTTLYFAVFAEEGNAYKGVTIEKGETKSITINL